MDTPVDAPPRGFKVTTADDGGLLIQYRASGMGCAAVLFGVWLTGWSAACLLGTYSALFDLAGINYVLLLFMVVPFWFVEVFTVVFVAWLYLSVTKFLFGQEELIVERQLLWYRRRRVFRASEIKAVRQIKDGKEGEDNWPSWGLLVVAGSNVKLLSRQPIDKSDWFGPVVAKWAGVSFEPARAEAPKYEEI
jgi:hypothetical protein